jgi:hypothetical protein
MDVETGVAVGIADGVADITADGEEDRTGSDNPGEGDGVVAQAATTISNSNRMPADRCMPSLS